MKNNSNIFAQKLLAFLHDPVDKPFDILTHKDRAREYADILNVSGIDEAKGADVISSCMERALLPKEEIRQEFTKIRHPLSSGEISAPKISMDEVKGKIKDVFCRLSRQGLVDDKKRFLYLWRNLQELLKEVIPKISVIPADTRVPDHSLWEHLKIASAINASIIDKKLIQNNSLLLFTIGPVQSFISQARKAQDLYCGSFILSYLTSIAICEFIKRYGPTSIIYPDLLSQPLIDLYLERHLHIPVENSQREKAHIPSIPNRFVAIVPDTEPKGLKSLGEALEKRVKETWMEIVEGVLKSFDLEPVLISQTEDFPSVDWVGVPWRKGDKEIEIEDLKEIIEEDGLNEWRGLWEFAKKEGEHPPNIGLIYQLLYSATEKALAGRKNIRNFKQSLQYDKKCSICGEKQGEINKNKVEIGRFMAKNEQLCALCFTKRGLGRYIEDKIPQFPSFPSTAEVASSEFKEISMEKARDEMREYVEKFKEVVKEERFQKVSPLPKIKPKLGELHNLEGEWFYKENLTEKAFEKYIGISVSEGKLKELKDSLSKLTDKTGEPNPYFALIVFDADNIGKWLSGALLPDIEFAYNSDVWRKIPQKFKDKLPSKKLLTPAIHSSISSALKNHSLFFVLRIIEEEHLGKVVYSGGDDLLCFSNIKDIFTLLRKLRACFSGNVKIEDERIEVDWKNTSGFVEDENGIILTMGNRATVSAGIVIAHYKMPLGMVIKKAKEMVERAKKEDKDSFAIALLKRSGEERKAVFRWKYDNMDVLEAMDELSRYLTKEEMPYFSDNFIYTLRNEFAGLKIEGRFVGASDIFNMELKRLLMRAYNGAKEEREELVKKWSGVLKEIFWESGANMDNFLHLLEIASFVRKK